MSVRKTLRYIWNHPIGRKNRVQSTVDYFRWQIGSRLVAGPVVAPFVEGTSLVVKPGMAGATGNVYVGLHEFPEMAFLLHYLSEDDRFADIGANIGSFSVLASGVTQAKTIAFEPVPSTFAWMQKNVAINGLADLLDARNVGVGAENGRLSFTASEDSENHVATPADTGETVEVDVVTLDSVCLGPDGFGVPKLLKIDVEGFEGGVLTGATSVLDDPSCQAIIIEFNGMGSAHDYDEQALFDGLVGRGFEPVNYAPFERVLTTRDVRWPAPGNVLLVRDRSAAAATVASSRAYRVKRALI
ncbi:MAG: FkbM family methyltransferase [Myxococcota bacterium]|jgi:FkbM family methyltransferase